VVRIEKHPAAAHPSFLKQFLNTTLGFPRPKVNIQRLGFCAITAALNTRTGRPVQNKERWKELCEQASTERDSEKLIKLIEEITRLLEEKNARLRSKTPEEA
jgi:hypothetical protein